VQTRGIRRPFGRWLQSGGGSVWFTLRTSRHTAGGRTLHGGGAPTMRIDPADALGYPLLLAATLTAGILLGLLGRLVAGRGDQA
jgi:hypothetical protein